MLQIRESLFNGLHGLGYSQHDFCDLRPHVGVIIWKRKNAFRILFYGEVVEKSYKSWRCLWLIQCCTEHHQHWEPERKYVPALSSLKGYLHLPAVLTVSTRLNDQLVLFCMLSRGKPVCHSQGSDNQSQSLTSIHLQYTLENMVWLHFHFMFSGVCM